MGLPAADLARLSTLLDEAEEIEPPALQAWLAGLQGESARLAPALRDLLARQASKETDELFDRPPAFAPPAAGPAAGDAVGPYRLLSELGSGGMGVVWLAERADGSLKRKVALKLPHLSWAPGLAERFAREREILASLEHPHIARLYDAGLDAQGRPFMALEYVEGQPLDVYCRERAIGIPQRLRLLLQVAEAVAFAHGRLVLHRDLKPANILVTAEGQVRLLDFGVAKLMQGDSTAETALTQATGRALTLDYASPEQIRGEAIGTASDVYSLGVVAFELLAGTRPYRLKRGSAAELEEAITGQDVPLASAVAQDAAAAKALRGDLDAILNQALKKGTAERYATIDALAQDWRRHLEGQRVYARPDTFAYRLRRFLRQHRRPVAAGAVTVVAFGLALGVGATALVIGALLLGLGAALWQARQARAQARIARNEAKTAEAVQDFLEGVFRANAGDQVDPVSARQRSALQLLDDGAARIERALDDVPAAKLRVLKTLADVYDDMALYTRVAALRQQQVELSVRIEGDSSVAHVLALAELADTLNEGDRQGQAQAVLDRAEAILGRLPTPQPGARTRVDLAWALHYRKRDDASGMPFAERAVAALSADAEPRDRAWALFLLGKLRQIGGRLDAAREALLQAAAATAGMTRKRRLFEMTIDTALGYVELQSGNLDPAEAAYRRAIAAALAGNGEGSIAHASVLVQFGRLLAIRCRYPQALQVIRQACDFALHWPDAQERQSFGAYALNQEGMISVIHGRPLQAVEIYERRSSLGAGPEDELPQWLWSYWAQAAALTDLDRYDTALAALDDGDALASRHALRATEAGDSLPRQRVLTLAAAGRFDEAEAAWQRWAAAAAPADAAGALEKAVLEAARGHHRSAIDWAQRSIARLGPAPPGGGRRHLAWMKLLIGRAELAEGHLLDALPVLEEAQAIGIEVLDPAWSPLLADIQIALAEARWAAGDRAGASALARQATAIHARYPELGTRHAGRSPSSVLPPGAPRPPRT